MNILQEAQKAVSLIQGGRATLNSLIQQVKDGKQAVDADTQAELDALLEKEEGETRTAIADLRSAIAEYRAGS